MAVALHVFIRDKGAAESDDISVEHVFYGRDEAEADAKRVAHLAGCENYALADVEGRTAEMLEDIPDSEVPTWDDVEEDDEPIEVEGGQVEGEDEGG